MGQTGRALHLRVRGHVSFWRRKKQRTHDDFSGSAFADHLIAAGHSFDIEKDVKLLHEAKKGKLLSNLEHAEIMHHCANPLLRVVNGLAHAPDVLTSSYL